MGLIRKLLLPVLLSASVSFSGYCFDKYESSKKDWPADKNDVVYEIRNELKFLSQDLRVLNYAWNLTDVVNDNGSFGFSKNDIEIMAMSNVPLEYIKSVSSVKTKEGQVPYSGYDLQFLWNRNVPEDYVSDVLKECLENCSERFDSCSVHRFYEIGMKKDELFPKDTKKPNALIVLPSHDRNYAFETDDSVELINKIREKYDSFVRVIKTDDEYFNIRKKLRENGFHLNLNVIAGHGSLEEIVLGGPIFDFFVSLYNGESLFDLTDEDKLKEDMKYDNLGDVYFLFSCGTFEGGKYANNIGNMFVRNAVNGQIVYGATEPFRGGSDVILPSVNPFDVVILKEMKKNITFVHNPRLRKKKEIVDLRRKKPINLNEYWKRRKVNLFGR